MDTLAASLQDIISLLKDNMPFMLKFIGILWLIQIINWLIGYRLNILGIYPRSWHGLLGIIFSPFLHGNFNHVFFNTIPLLLLGSLVLVEGHLTFYLVSIMIIVLGGVLTWAFARSAIHVGSSILIMGYFGYLLSHAYYHFNITTIILALICLYYFGGLIVALFPGEKRMSWEGHVFGFIAGISAAYVIPLLIKT